MSLTEGDSVHCFLSETVSKFFVYSNEQIASTYGRTQCNRETFFYSVGVMSTLVFEENERGGDMTRMHSINRDIFKEYI